MRKRIKFGVIPMIAMLLLAVGIVGFQKSILKKEYREEVRM